MKHGGMCSKGPRAGLADTRVKNTCVTLKRSTLHKPGKFPLRIALGLSPDEKDLFLLALAFNMGCADRRRAARARICYNDRYQKAEEVRT